MLYWESLSSRSNKLRDRERAQVFLEYLQPINDDIQSLGNDAYTIYFLFIKFSKSACAISNQQLKFVSKPFRNNIIYLSTANSFAIIFICSEVFIYLLTEFNLDSVRNKMSE